MVELVAEVSGAGPAVVLLHGQPGGHDDWIPIVRRLRDEFLIVVPDRPGYGRTGGAAQGFRANAAAVLALLDRMAVRRATVVGFSWAGAVALALAEVAPERVAGLVLVSSVDPGEALGWLDRALALPPVGVAAAAVALFLARAVVALAPARRALRRRQRSIADDDYVPAPEAVLATWRRDRMWRSFALEQRRLVDELPSLASGLAGIDAPTVVLVGSADRMVPPANGRRLAGTIPGARLVELAGAGHLLAHQQPDAVAQAVRDVTPR